MKLLAVLLVAFAVYTTTSAGSGTLCKLCVDFVTDIQTAINQDVPDLGKQANQICDKITLGNAQLDAYCKKLVSADLQLIVDLIKAGGTPQDVCTKIFFCKKGAVTPRPVSPKP